MTRSFRLAFLLSLGIPLCPPNLAQAQTFPQTTSGSVAELNFGQSVLPLYGPWKFHIGDSPIDPQTRQPLWSEPGFDDSTWETIDLTPHPAKLDANGQMPGWAALGHPRQSGYGWYRIQIKIGAPVTEKLALAGPTQFDDAYQLFLNGSQIGEFGFAGKQPQVYFAQPAQFQLPLERGSPSQPESRSAPTQLIAFRFWAAPATLVQQADAGGFHDAPLVGTAQAISLVNQVSWLALVKAQAATMLSGVIFTLLGGMAFVLFLYSPSDRAYFWMTPSCLLGGAVSLEYAFAALAHEVFTAHTDLWLGNVSLLPAVRFCWFMLLRAWFHLERPRWLPSAVALLTLLQAVAIAVALGLIPSVPDSLAPVSAIVSLALSLLVLLAMTWILYRGIRNSPVEGSFLLSIFAISWLDWLGAVFPHMGLSRIYAPYGFTIRADQITGFAVALTICALLIRRWIQSVQDQRQMALDVKQAQEVQQVILPESHVSHPGFTIESVYRPAREVGGDFFQIIPGSPASSELDGSILIVAGDVAGKGLQAGMLVALLVGAARNQTESSFDPSLMLQALNRRLIGRRDSGNDNAAATCLALHIAADGSATLANSGHLPPYLNGEPLPMEGALPLGMLAAAEPSVMQFQLQPSDRLILISDGILEASDHTGQLFGFHRIQTLLASPVSATAIADAAQSFGQNDDISVILLTRTPTSPTAESP